MELVSHQSIVNSIDKRFFRTLTLIFTFLVYLRFPSRFPLLQFISNQYGDAIVKLDCKFEKGNLKHCKAVLDLNFIQTFWSFKCYPKIFCHQQKSQKITSSPKLSESSTVTRY